MRPLQIISSSFAIAATLAICARVSAKESDQYTVPPEPLADIGPEVQQIITDELTRILDETNARLAMHRARAKALPPGEPRQWNEQQAELLSSREHMAARLFDSLGDGFPETELERRIREREFAAQPALHEISCGESVYCDVIAARPLISVGVVPTVNCFGIYTGIDKLGHMLQQGHEYFRTYSKSMRRDETSAQAIDKAVRHGISQERGIYGYLPSGSYSNADLASNLAGLMLYRNLTEEIDLVGVRRPAILRFDDAGLWQFNPAAGPQFIRPFITEHFNEAMNPPELDWAIRDGVRDQIASRVEDWLEFHHTTAVRERGRVTRLKQWRGMEYGHSGDDKVILISDVADAASSLGAARLDSPLPAGPGSAPGGDPSRER